LIQNAIDRNTLPGAVILATHRGQTIYEEAFGLADKRGGRTHQMDDLFYLGSTSKPLLATSILSLIRKGKLALDTPVSTWIPELGKARLKDGTSVRSPVVAEMLSHTSGIFGNTTASRSQQQLVWNFSSSLARTATQIAKQPFVYSPGEGFSYGGASMTIMGRIAEIITGTEFDEFAEQAVFKKLGMCDTFYRTDKELKNRLSILYTQSASRLYKARFQPQTTPGSFILPPGGIISTAQDLSALLHLHLSDEKTEILSSDLIAAMRRDATKGTPMDFKSSSRTKSTASIANNEGYGLGWMLDEIGPDQNARIFFHGGAFGTLIWGDTKSRLGIVLLTHVPLAQVAKLWDKVISIARKTWG
jgi:CubicO group peptidase (beta-lactamase class C family)